MKYVVVIGIFFSYLWQRFWNKSGGGKYLEKCVEKDGFSYKEKHNRKKHSRPAR